MDGNGIAKINGSNRVVAEVLIGRLNIVGSIFREKMDGMIRRSRNNNGIKSLVIHNNASVRKVFQTTYSGFKKDVRPELLEFCQRRLGNDCA